MFGPHFTIILSSKDKLIAPGFAEVEVLEEEEKKTKKPKK